MAFVIVQHLSMDHESNLAMILTRSTGLEVLFLTEDITPEPNTIYIRPPDKEVNVAGGRLCLSPREQSDNRVYLPIDHFLMSLAYDQESYAIAVILSGMGSDGSRGIKEIKEKGGIVLVQSPESAQFSGMPSAAIRYEVADKVGPPAELAKTIDSIAKREADPNQSKVFLNIPPNEFDEFVGRIIKRINQEFKMDFSRYRSSTIRRRIEKRLLIHEIEKPSEYLRLLFTDQEELRILAQSFLIGVTRFFRDPSAFEILENKIIPQLAAMATPRTPIRIWVPSCSTGEEAYSIGMIVDNYLSTHKPQLEFKILASDLDPKAIQVAGEGFYQDNVQADIPARFLEKYLDSTYGGFRIVPKLRDKILFAVQNLLTDPPFIHIDLLSCRNFLIYVDAEAQTRVLSNFHFALNPEGFLMLGPSESLGQLQRAFFTIDRRWKIFTRKPTGKKELPFSGNREPLPENVVSRLSLSRKRFLSEQAEEEVHLVPSLDLPMGDQDHFAQFLSGQYAPASIFVDKKYRIRYINGNLDDFFHFPKNFAELVLGKVLDAKISALLQAGVDSLLSADNNQENELTIDSLEVKEIIYEATLREVVFERLSDRFVMIQIKKVSLIENSEGKPTKINPDQLLQRRVHSLEERLILSEQRGRRLLNELETTNEELQTSNRELLASNEEMQSTNEELQSVNEELHTVNQEMQSKNDQLKTLNNDINHLLESTEIGTIFLDGDLIIRRFTPSIRQQFDLKQSDISRPLSSFSSSFVDLNLADRCRSVLSNLERYEEEIMDRHGKSYLLRILPNQGPDADTVGLIVTFIDISDLVETRIQLSETAAKYEVLLNNFEDTIAIVNQTARIEQVNRWLSPGSSAAEIIGCYVVDLIESDAEQIRFHNALRQVFDNGVTVRDVFKISTTGAEKIYAEISFLLNPGRDLDGRAKTEDTAILIMRDVSETVKEQKRNRELIEEYREKLKESNSQGGLMDLAGNILDLNKSRQKDMTAEDFIQRSVHDFLTETGSAKIMAAFDKLKNGSFREIVHYLEEDTILSDGQGGMDVAYEPIISNGEIICVLVKNLNDNIN